MLDEPILRVNIHTATGEVSVVGYDNGTIILRRADVVKPRVHSMSFSRHELDELKHIIITLQQEVDRIEGNP